MEFTECEHKHCKAPVRNPNQGRGRPTKYCCKECKNAAAQRLFRDRKQLKRKESVRQGSNRNL